MPRIDPQQLLNCLQVLLTPSGGILSKNEVQRLANLMTKFSKKLVSKCIYVLILKNTDKHLLGAFMGEGGWNLVHLWLQDAHLNKNWALVAEILELLLITPVDVERLKMNNMPKLVKGLTKRDDLPGIQKLASTLVEDWLVIVKDVTKAEQAILARTEQQQQQQQLIQLQQQQQQIPVEAQEVNVEGSNDDDAMEVDETINSDNNTIVSENGVDTTLRIKFVRDGKKVISRVVAIRTNDNITSISAPVTTTDNHDEIAKGADKENSDKKDSNKIVTKKSSSSSSSARKSSSSSDKDKSRDKTRSSSHSHSSSSSSRSTSRDKDRDRHKSSSSSSSKHRSSSSSSKSSSSKDKKDTKEKQAEKDKDTLAKLKPQTLEKVGRIPKKTEDKSKIKKEEDKTEKKKPSFSVEVRRNSEEKPKTVKVYNSKMRNTGLLEEVKPPPPRSAAKKSPVPLPSVIPTKRPSPVRDSIPPPEKKSRLTDPEKGIKLIPPKPKPPVLQESDIFMDALAASATSNKKDPKKRKRRPSASKETSPPTSPSTKPSSPTVLRNITPANFYQDTLMINDAEESDTSNKERESIDADGKENAEDNKSRIPDTPAEPDEEPETLKNEPKTLKGVLSYGKKKGPKRSIRWRPDNELVEVQYFELDETERVNVMKPFLDMARMEMNSEREALRCRKLTNEDTMDTQISWQKPLELDLPDPPAEYGCKSLEKGIQFAREKHVLQAIYFNNRIPDSPAEPDHEVHQMVNPITIPLDDPEHADNDAPAQVWPEPKGSPPHTSTNVVPNVFPNLGAPPFIAMAPNQFQANGIAPPFNPAAFGAPNLLNRPTGEWNGLPNTGLPANIPPPEMQAGPVIFDHFPPTENGFIPPFNGPPGNQIPPFMNPNNFHMRGRPAFRRGAPSNGPWLRMGGPNQAGWNPRPAGGIRPSGRGFCNSFKKNGFCRNRDNCPYIH